MTNGGVTPGFLVIPAKAGIHWAWTRLTCFLAICLACLAPRVVLAQGYVLTPWPAGQPSPSLAVTDLQGQRWQWTDLRGRAVLINFWASWCEPCLAEMPALQQLAREQGSDRLVVLTVNFKEPESRIQRFVQQTGLALPVIPDPAGELARAWGVTVFPSTVLVGADGRVRSVLRGELDWTSPQAVRLLGPLLRR